MQPGRLSGVLITVASLSIVSATATGCANTQNASTGDYGVSTGDEVNISAPPRQQGPISQLLDSLWGTGLSPEEQARQMEIETLRQEEETAQCMRDAGFEYVPSPQANVIGFTFTDFRPDDRDWVAQWGYAVVSAPLADAPDNGAPTTQIVNPNFATMERLSEAELAAWMQAYWGVDDETPGCMQLGSQVVETRIGRRIEVYEEFRPLLESFWQIRNTVFEGPEFAAIHRDWAYCMADAGYPGLEWQWEARSRLDDWLEEAGLNNEDLARFPRTPEINAMAELEISLALADFDCRLSTYFQPRSDGLETAVETQFANDNQSAISALRTAIEQLD